MSAEDNKSIVGDDVEEHEVRHPTFDRQPEETEAIIPGRVRAIADARERDIETINALRRDNEALRSELDRIQQVFGTAPLRGAATPAPGRYTVPPITPSASLAPMRTAVPLATPTANPYINRNIASVSESSSSTPKIKIDWPAHFTGIVGQGPVLRHWGYGMADVNAVRGISLADDVDTSTAILEAATRLSQSALEWYHDTWLPLAAAIEQAGVKPKWSQFMAHLQAMFEPLPPSFIARAELKSLRQTGALADYIHRFRLLSSRIPDMAEADRVERFIDGLKPALAAKVTISLCEDLITATSVAIKLEASYQALQLNRAQVARPPFVARGRQFNAPNAPARHGAVAAVPMELGHVATHDDTYDEHEESVSSPSLAALQQQQRAPIPKLTDAVKAELAAQGKCYRCRQKGHIARNCTFFDPKN